MAHIVGTDKREHQLGCLNAYLVWENSPTVPLSWAALGLLIVDLVVDVPTEYSCMCVLRYRQGC